jgi:hypothetical protein
MGGVSVLAALGLFALGLALGFRFGERYGALRAWKAAITMADEAMRRDNDEN